jgi:hypothetical protein
MRPLQAGTELLKKLDTGEQFVLHLFGESAVFRDEIVVQINFPLHLL